MGLIEYKNVYIGYDKKSNILENVNFSLEEGSVTALLGPNGSGKSTLMSTMNNLLKANAGDIIIDGKNIKRMSTREISQKIAFVPQVSKTGFSFSVREAILWGRAPYITYLPRDNDHKIVENVIKQFHIERLADKSFNEISGGERQMVMIARAIAQEAPIVLMDEPATYLDLFNQTQVLNVIRDINRERNVTFIITLHDPNHAMYISDNVMMIKNGHVRIGTRDEIMTEENLMDLYGIRCDIDGAGIDRNVRVRFS